MLMLKMMILSVWIIIVVVVVVTMMMMMMIIVGWKPQRHLWYMAMIPATRTGIQLVST